MHKMEILINIFESIRAEKVQHKVGAEKQAECVPFLESRPSRFELVINQEASQLQGSESPLRAKTQNNTGHQHPLWYSPFFNWEWWAAHSSKSQPISRQPDVNTKVETHAPLPPPPLLFLPARAGLHFQTWSRLLFSAPLTHQQLSAERCCLCVFPSGCGEFVFCEGKSMISMRISTFHWQTYAKNLFD